jgi:hypothetical protein
MLVCNHDANQHSHRMGRATAEEVALEALKNFTG